MYPDQSTTLLLPLCDGVGGVFMGRGGSADSQPSLM